MNGLEKIAEEKIKAAMEAGLFDNLRGKGKPLNLEDDPLADPMMAAVGRILQNEGLSLPWIEMRRDIEADLQAERQKLEAARAWQRTARTVGISPSLMRSEWNRAAAEFQAAAGPLNRRIRDYNLQVPAPVFQRPPIDIVKETELRAN